VFVGVGVRVAVGVGVRAGVGVGIGVVVEVAVAGGTCAARTSCGETSKAPSRTAIPTPIN
jgi:hypothetical protein